MRFSLVGIGIGIGLALVAACASTAAAPPPASLPAPAPAAALEIPAPGALMPPFDVTRWVNSAPLTPESLRGKVVLVDFWEYTCINCLRTLPYVKAWNARYAQSGLVVVGLHAPEFEFGKRTENIERGIKDNGLTYPIGLDNDFKTWMAFHNNAWPAKYLFGADGKLRDYWLGEGSYDDIENAIRALLVEAHPGATLPPMTNEVSQFSEDFSAHEGLTPETYLGAGRRQEGSFRLDGEWATSDELIEHRGAGEGKIMLDFVGGEVNLVLQPGQSGASELDVMLDGAPVAAGKAGADVHDGVARVDRAGMFRLVAHAGKSAHKLVLTTRDPGLRAFAFTFGP